MSGEAEFGGGGGDVPFTLDSEEVRSGGVMSNRLTGVGIAIALFSGSCRAFPDIGSA